MDTKNKSPAFDLLLDIAKAQEVKSPELKAKQLRLPERLAGTHPLPSDPTGTGELFPMVVLTT